MTSDAQSLKRFLAPLQEQYLRDTFRISPCHSNRASSVGHPCARYLTYSRTHWNQRMVPDVRLMAIFKLGWDLEEIVFRWLKDRLKLEIIQPKERDFSWAAYQMTGHMDFYCNEKKSGIWLPEQYDRELWVPWECKGISSGTWDVIDSWNDMLRAKQHWIQKWVGQLPCYLVMDEKPYGRFILFQKETGLLKDLPVELEPNLQLVENIIRRLEVVNYSIVSGELPPRFYEPNEPSTICDGCEFEHICLPGSGFEEALRLMADPVVEKLLAQELELKDAVKMVAAEAKQLEEVQEKLKRFFEDKPRVLIGNYLVTGSWVDRKAQDASRYWRRNVKTATK